MCKYSSLIIFNHQNLWPQKKVSRSRKVSVYFDLNRLIGQSRFETVYYSAWKLRFCTTEVPNNLKIIQYNCTKSTKLCAIDVSKILVLNLKHQYFQNLISPSPTADIDRLLIAWACSSVFKCFGQHVSVVLIFDRWRPIRHITIHSYVKLYPPNIA